MQEKMIIYVDIDETICTTPGNKNTARNYGNAKPILKNIEKCNKLYDDGNTIVYWTARGTKTGDDWYDVTKKQLIEWNVKHHDLILNKPYYDLFIDDKAINSESFFNQKEE